MAQVTARSNPGTCYGCKHFHLEAGSPGYSEMTPGDNMSMYCGKDVWSFDSFGTTEAEFREIMRTGETCEKYSPAGDR